MTLPVIFNAPPPRRRIVDGVEIVETVFRGQVVPKWVVIGLLAIVVAINYGLCNWIANRFWPDGKWVEVKEGSVVYDRAGGGVVIWTPSEPGGGSPFDYTRAVFTPEMSVEEFWKQQPPEMILTLVHGSKEVMAELDRFTEMQEEWFRLAPEATMRQLTDGIENVVSDNPLNNEEFWTLVLAFETRGIPDLATLRSVADKIPFESVRERWHRDLDEIENPKDPTE